MQVRGLWVVLLLVGASVGFMAVFFLVGEELRQDYHVLSRGDRERTDVALTPDRVVWLEHFPNGASVLSFELSELASRIRNRTALADLTALPDSRVAASGARTAWTTRDGVVVHDGPTNTTRSFSGARLPGPALEGRLLVLDGGAGFAGMRLFDLDVQTFAPDGGIPLAIPAGADVQVDQGRAFWAEGAQLHVLDLRSMARSQLMAGGNITSFDADGARVVWAEDHGRIRRVVLAELPGGERREVSSFTSDQHRPAINGTRVAFVQHDGLVRLHDLASGEERVLPARTQENRSLRLGADWAVWLSGTIEGHNVLLVPLKG